MASSEAKPIQIFVEGLLLTFQSRSASEDGITVRRIPSPRERFCTGFTSHVLHRQVFFVRDSLCRRIRRHVRWCGDRTCGSMRLNANGVFIVEQPRFLLARSGLSTSTRNLAEKHGVVADKFENERNMSVLNSFHGHQPEQVNIPSTLSLTVVISTPNLDCFLNQVIREHESYNNSLSNRIEDSAAAQLKEFHENIRGSGAGDEVDHELFPTHTFTGSISDFLRVLRRH
jgi:hypothetical protein